MNLTKKKNMKMLKSIVFVAAMVFLPSVSISTVQSDQDTPEDIVSIAEQGFLYFLNNSDPHFLEGGGWWFPDDEADKFVLGEPYPVFSLDLRQLISIDDERDFISALTFLRWNIPVSYNEQPRTLIGVQETEGKWECSEFGRDPSPIFYARLKWPSSEGYKHSYIMSGKGPDFLAIEKGPELFFYPFNDRNKYLLDIQRGDDGHYPVISFDTMMMKLFDAIEEGKVRLNN